MCYGVLLRCLFLGFAHPTPDCASRSPYEIYLADILLASSYILTNRHVVGSGPFWGHCVFDNHEEVDCYPVYRDPVHDFGILRYDPKAIKYMHVDGLTLSPDLAKGALRV